MSTINVLIIIFGIILLVGVLYYEKKKINKVVDDILDAVDSIDKILDKKGNVLIYNEEGHSNE